MTILKERQVWVRVSGRRQRDPLDRLNQEQRDGVRRAIATLSGRYGSLTKLAKAMGVHSTTVIRSARVTGKPSAGLAVKLAKLAGVPVDDVLSGAFPKPGSCPVCGRCG